MASSVGPVLSLNTSVNFVLYKLSVENISSLLNEMKDPSYKAALSPPSHFCPHVVRKVLSYCFVYLVRKKNK